MRLGRYAANTISWHRNRHGALVVGDGRDGRDEGFKLLRRDSAVNKLGDNRTVYRRIQLQVQPRRLKRVHRDAANPVEQIRIAQSRPPRGEVSRTVHHVHEAADAVWLTNELKWLGRPSVGRHGCTPGQRECPACCHLHAHTHRLIAPRIAEAINESNRPTFEMTLRPRIKRCAMSEFSWRRADRASCETGARRGMRTSQP